MLGCTCKRAHLKRRSIARCCRASSSISANHSRVAATLRFLAAASAIVVSRFRVITDRFSCWSFCSRGVIGFLSGFEDKSVIFKQRDGLGYECVQARISQLQWRLRASWGLLLAQNVGDVVGAKSSCPSRFLDCARNWFGPILAYQF